MYFPKKITLKKNWDSEQIWDITAIALDLQKPAEIRKAKYEEEKRRKNTDTNPEEELEEEDGYFDPTANPFDPNQKKRRRNNPTGYSY